MAALFLRLAIWQNDGMQNQQNEWVSVAEAVASMGISQRQIYRLRDASAIETRKVPIPGRKPAVEVKVSSLLPHLPGNVRPVLVESENRGVALQGAARPGASSSQLAAAAISGALPVAPALWVTIAQAAEWSGLPCALLLKACRSGQVRAIKTGRGWRVHSASLVLL